jgi:UDP-3-O-[3-hydroxymyristoyl] glucosamine N-acyltransferase
MAAPASRTLTAAEIAAATGGAVVGDANASVSAVAPLDRATASDLSFLAHAKYAPAFSESRAGIVLITRELAETAGVAAARVIVDKPHDALIALLPKLYSPPALVAGIHPSAIVGEGATVAADACVEAFAVIGAGASVGPRAWIGPHSVVGEGVSVGADSRLFPHVTLYPGVRIGERSAIHAGTRLGSDGFGYAFAGGAHRKIPHVGRCLVGNDVEIGANCTIDRGSIDDTVIGDGSKLDNLVHIAHNVKIGRLCLIMAHVGIAGSTRLEDGVIMAGQAGAAGHLTIGAQARIAAAAGVIGDVPAGETWSGYPARPHKEAMRASAALFKFAGMIKRLERLLEKSGE